jgi:hypothetical protein
MVMARQRFVLPMTTNTQRVAQVQPARLPCLPEMSKATDGQAAACAAREPMPHAPTATPQRPDADIFIPARERRALVRNGFYLAGRPATFARHRGSLVRKQRTLKRKVRSVGPRRSSAPLARCKPSRVPPIPSRARRPASRARLRHLSGQGRKPRPRPFAGWMQTVARCMRRSGRCAQGREGLRSEVWCLHTGPRT